jgi:hypothetical protein
MKVKFQTINTKQQLYALSFMLSALNSTLSALRFMLFIFIILAADVFADIYAPTDSIILTVGCLDSTFLNIANPDSVWFK